MDSEPTGLNTRQALGVIRGRAKLILLCLVLVAGAAYGYSKQQTKMYTATAAVAFNNNPLDRQIAGLSVSTSPESLLAQQTSNLELVRFGDIAMKTARLLGHGLTDGKVSASLSISAQGETSSSQRETTIIDVSATSASPILAAAIANTYARQFVKEHWAVNRHYFKSVLTLVNKQLEKLPPEQRFGADALTLENRAQTVSLLSELNYGGASVAQRAFAPSSPSSPRTKRNTILGAILGLLLGLGITFLLERFDRRIRTPEDLEMIYGLPKLGVVPKSAALSQSAREEGGQRTALPTAEAEAFSLIRAHLRFFNVDRDVRTVLIASPASGDGKTTIARHLAETAAKSGSRTLLLELDLRHPKLAHQLAVKATPGLVDVLIGAVQMDEATQPVELQAPSGEWVQRWELDLLAAGAAPPNPGELLESRAMDAVLTRARSTYDFVVIDTPPLTAVSDAFPLLTKADGVVIVGRIGHGRRDAAERLHQVLVSSHAPLLGIIANGSESGGPDSYFTDARRPFSRVPAKANFSSEELSPTAKTGAHSST